MAVKPKISIADRTQRQKGVELEAAVFTDEHGYAPPVESDAVYFVAEIEDGSVVASFRILGPANRPFYFESAADCPGSIPPPPRKVALIGRLCVRSDYRTISRQTTLHYGLLRSAFDYCRQSGIDDLLLYTIPSLVTFYERALFNCTGASFFHSGYSRRLEILHLDIDRITSNLVAADPRTTMLYGNDRAT